MFPKVCTRRSICIATPLTRIPYACQTASKRGFNSYNSYHYVLPIFGLSDYCPADAIENYLHSMHDTLNMPYFAAICTLPFLTKFLIRLPLDVLCTKSHETASKQMANINEDKFEALVTILQHKLHTDRSVLATYIHCANKQFQAKFTRFFPSLVAFYMHVSCYIAIERMTFHESAFDAQSQFGIFRDELLSSTDPYFILPVINGFGLMFCYAFINQWKAANFKQRRRNVKSSLLFIPWSVLFISTGFHFYVLSNLLSIMVYNKLTMQNEAFQRSMGLLSNEDKYQLSNMHKMSELYIEWNRQNFAADSMGTFHESFHDHDNPTYLMEDLKAVYEDDRLFKPTLPPKDWFRNIEDELEYFDDEYDDFVARIEDKNEQRYLDGNRETLWLEEHDSLLLDEEEKRKVIEANRQKLIQ